MTSATITQAESDVMLSVVEVARLMGVGTPTAVMYVSELGLRSLDEGELIEAGRFGFAAD